MAVVAAGAAGTVFALAGPGGAASHRPGHRALGAQALPSAAPASPARRPLPPSPGTPGPQPPGAAHSAADPGTPPGSTPQPQATAPSPLKSSPRPSSPTPSPAPAGQAAFGGNWAGSVSQPGWSAPVWELDLAIPASGVNGSYSAPTLGCVGVLQITGVSGGELTATIKTDSPLPSGCIKRADLTLTLGGPGQASLVWQPPGKHKPTGTGVLSHG